MAGNDMSRLTSDKRLQTALDLVRSNPQDTEAFAKNPEGYLKGKGVDTEGLRFGAPGTGELTDNQLEQVAGGVHICGDVGGGVSVGVEIDVCATVGDDFFEC
jgi:hypothetical protein